MVLGSVKDEQCFSIVSFMKSKLKSKLRNHVDLIIKMSTQDQYSIDNFPFGDAIKA